MCVSAGIGSLSLSLISHFMNREMGLLEEARRLLSTERHSNMAIYVKIAATLPHKTARDVAYKFMELNNRVSVFFYVKIIYYSLFWDG